LTLASTFSAPRLLQLSKGVATNGCYSHEQIKS
jgi:hypothetical protein